MSRVLFCVLIYIFGGFYSFDVGAVECDFPPERIVMWDSDYARSGVYGLRMGCRFIDNSCHGKIRANKGKNISVAHYWRGKSEVDFMGEVNLIDWTEYDVEYSLDDFGDLSRAFRTLDFKIFNKFARDKKLAVTLYESDLLNNESELRRRVDGVEVGRVVLYLHYRNSYKNYGNFIKKIKDIFPAANIYLGVYHYDRQDYVSCDVSGGRCENSEDLDLFEKTFEVQLRFLSDGVVSGLEFYPGNFGSESKWAGWDNMRICSSDRLGQCKANSVRMGKMVLERFRCQ